MQEAFFFLSFYLHPILDWCYQVIKWKIIVGRGKARGDIKFLSVSSFQRIMTSLITFWNWGIPFSKKGFGEVSLLLEHYILFESLSMFNYTSFYLTSVSRFLMRFSFEGLNNKLLQLILFKKSAPLIFGFPYTWCRSSRLLIISYQSVKILLWR